MRMMRLRGDGGSLPMALLVITVTMSLSAAITPLVVRQFVSTRSYTERNTALNAAQVGMDSMMARVRAAADLELNGLLENLPPCSMAGNASVADAGEKLTFAVTVAYKDQDGDPLTCASATTGPSKVPTTAIVTSVGRSGGRVARTLTATYVFTTSNTNIPGGEIRIDSSTLGNQCIDATTKTPTTSTRPLMKTCNGGSTQQFGYTQDLYLKLINTESSTALYGMCLDPGATHSASTVLTFNACPATRTPRYQWSLDNNSQFHSTNSSSGIEGYCLAVLSPNTANSQVGLVSCNNNVSQTLFRSGNGVGAGMAGDATAQLVNYAQFSRCLDVTGQSVSSSYMIAWFCKQAPNGVVNWNQTWVHPVPSPPAITAVGNIITTYSNAPYCLRSPLNPASNVYVTVQACNSSNQNNADLKWTVYHDTGTYATSYRIMDTAGYCLTPTDQYAAVRDVHGDGTSKVKVAVCNSSELQKWNAPPNINKPTPLTDLMEK